MQPVLTAVAQIFALNTRLPDTNSLAFLAAHLTDARHYASNVAGRPLANPLERRLTGNSLDEVGPLPPLAEIAAAWDAVSTHLLAVLGQLSAEDLAREATRRLPGSDGTAGTVLPFLAQHDTYHIGQMSLLRRQLGLPAMKY